MSTFGPSFFKGPLYLRQIPGNAKSGRGSLPVSENQCHVAGFTSPSSSQNDDAGTRHRHSSKDVLQNELFRIESSRTFVNGLGARSFITSKKPQFIVTISRSPSAAGSTTGATCRGKIADAGLNAALRLWETRKNRATASRFLLREYKLHIDGYLTGTSCRSHPSRDVIPVVHQLGEVL
jgi:hypothetical protein